MEAGQEVGERLPADDGHQRQPDRRVHRVAAAHPVPEAEHVGAVDTECLDEFLVRRHRDEVLGHRVVAEGVGEPTACRGGVGQCLQGGECLGGNDEKRCGRVESVELGDQVGGVDVGDEPGRDAAVGVVAQCLVGHRRTEVRASDADVHHGLDAFAGRPRPLTGTQPVGEAAHRVEHGMDVGHGVLAVDLEGGVPRQAQGGVQHGPVLGGVDVLAGEHGVTALLQACRAGQIHQQCQGLPGDPVLAVVDIEVTDGQRQFPAAVGVLGEELSQVHVGDIGVVAGQCLPGGTGGDIRNLGAHSPDPMRQLAVMG